MRHLGAYQTKSTIYFVTDKINCSLYDYIQKFQTIKLEAIKKIIEGVAKGLQFL